MKYELIQHPVAYPQFAFANGKLPHGGSCQISGIEKRGVEG
jgi:hypothetical protein